MVRYLRRDIDRPRHAVEGVEKIGKALPIPFEALGQNRARYVLDPLHQIDQGGAMVGPHRRETDAAIAEQDRCHPVPGGRSQDRVPGRLAIVMGVDIDPARRHQHPIGVDDPPSRAGFAADRGDPLAVDCNIAGECRSTSAVDDGAAADDDVMHSRTLLPSSHFSPRSMRPQTRITLCRASKAVLQATAAARLCDATVAGSRQSRRSIAMARSCPSGWCKSERSLRSPLVRRPVVEVCASRCRRNGRTYIAAARSACNGTGTYLVPESESSRDVKVQPINIS